MALIHYLVFALGLLLEVLILWRSMRERMWRHYPFFYTYLLYVSILAVVLFVLVQIQLKAYGIIFWLADAGAVLLSFCVTWEVFRHTFSSDLAIRRTLGAVFVALSMGLAAIIFFGSKNLGSVFADLERKSGFAQAVFLLFTLSLARYYNISLGRNIWGMALGFGIFLSVSIMNFAALELLDSFTLFWRWIRPVSFIGMLAVWTWALWSYAPNLKLNPALIAESERRLADWKRGWDRVRKTLREVAGL